MTDTTDTPTPAPKKAPKLYTIPAGTPVKVCRASICSARIWFVQSETSDKKVPLDVNCIGGLEPTDSESGKGIIHHIRCPAAHAFHHRGKRPPAEPPPPAQRELGIGGRPAKCIVCGCQRARPCMTPFTDFSVARQAEIELREGFRGAAEPPKVVACAWLSIDPPICDAPTCHAQFESLPLQQRLRATKSIEAARAEKAVAPVRRPTTADGLLAEWDTVRPFLVSESFKGKTLGEDQAIARFIDAMDDLKDGARRTPERADG